MRIDLRGSLYVDRFEEVSVSYEAPEPSGFVLPSGLGQYWRLRWDEEIPPENVVRPSAYNVNGGTPATRTTKEGAFVPFYQEHQTWLFEEVWFNMAPPKWVAEHKATRLEKQQYTTLARKFLTWSHSKLAWFNHQHGSDVRAFYPLGVNLKKLDGSPNTPIAQQMLGSAGNLVLQVAASYKDGKGITWVPCKALKPNELPAWNQLKYMPWVINCCTVQRSVEIEANGLHRVNPFPELTMENGLVYDVPLILTSLNGIITFNQNMLEPVAAGSKVPCPYNPYRKFGPALNVWN
jgi:hypothetical protein